MGLFDRLFNRGLREAGRAIGNSVSKSFSSSMQSGNTCERSDSSRLQTDTGSFEEKLIASLTNLGDYEIKKDISPDVLENESGCVLYTRGGCYSIPNNFTYAIYRYGQRVMFVNLWNSYTDYKRQANRMIKKYCDLNGIRVLDFFSHLPNRADYMEDRLRSALI